MKAKLFVSKKFVQIAFRNTDNQNFLLSLQFCESHYLDFKKEKKKKNTTLIYVKDKSNLKHSCSLEELLG